jgi:hypothetical protein
MPGQVCSTFIALAMLASAGLSAAAILRSKDDFWVLFDTKGATPAYHIQCACAPPCLLAPFTTCMRPDQAPLCRTGWYTYHVGGDNAPVKSLQVRVSSIFSTFLCKRVCTCTTAACGRPGRFCISHLCMRCRHSPHAWDTGYMSVRRLQDGKMALGTGAGAQR